MFKVIKKQSNVSSLDYFVQFISMDYNFEHDENLKRIDEQYHVRKSLFREYPVGGYYYRQCLQTDHILNLVLRVLHWGRANENDLLITLQNLRTYCEEKEITSLVFNKQLCCGGFDWVVVYRKIHEVFDNWSGDITILMPDKTEQETEDEDPAA